MAEKRRGGLLVCSFTGNPYFVAIIKHMAFLRGLQLTSILAITGFIIVNAVVHSHGDDDNYPQHYSSYDQHNVDPKRTALRVKCDG